MARRTVVAGLAAGAVLAAGCSVSWGDSDAVPAPAPAPSPSPSHDPAVTAQAIDLLRSGRDFIDETSFRADVDIAGQILTVSRTDNVRKRATSTVSGNGQTIEVRMIDDDAYLKTDLPLAGVGDGWMLLDRDKVPPGFAMGFDPGNNDPGGSDRLINAIVSAEVSGLQITGTIDLTEVGTGNGISFQPGPGGRLPDSARSQPFHATLDDEGRLIDFVIPAYGGSPPASLEYSSFGVEVSVSRPDDAVPAPNVLYPQLGVP